MMAFCSGDEQKEEGKRYANERISKNGYVNAGARSTAMHTAFTVVFV